jgi:hypothetical protein
MHVPATVALLGAQVGYLICRRLGPAMLDRGDANRVGN